MPTLYGESVNDIDVDVFFNSCSEIERDELAELVIDHIQKHPHLMQRVIYGTRGYTIDDLVALWIGDTPESITFIFRVMNELMWKVKNRDFSELHVK